MSSLTFQNDKLASLELSGHPVSVMHFSNSCAKCIAAIASGCAPQRLFVPACWLIAVLNLPL